MCYWQRDRHIDPWNRKDRPIIDPIKYEPLIFDTRVKKIKWRKGSLSTNGKIGHLNAKKWIPTSHLI